MIKKLLSNSFLKYLLIGGLNTVFGYSIFAVYTFLLGNAYLSLILSTVTSVLFNFKTYGVLVFKSHDNSKIFRFFAAYAFIIAIQMVLYNGLTQVGITNPYLAVGILVLPMAMLSFVLLRKFVFHQPLIIEQEAPVSKLDV